MWISEKLAAARRQETMELGVTTIGGPQAAVLVRAEERQLPLYGPGGYLWQPAPGQTVLLLRGGSNGAERCVAGCLQQTAPVEMEPGEIFLFAAGGGSIYLRRDGRICLRGKVEIEGDLTVSGAVREKELPQQM